ncbi:DUF4132 domain-containing protein [Actinoplanes sp. NBC_00393]|uniref:DUF4132 domain-containing protein n=1 Tax=Actinoplanes sp. NBC_00393 TaxID=2975953 RepID=UPI002E237D13
MIVAPATALPPLLTDPPWLHPVKPAKPVVIPGLACTDPATISWLPGEREQWRRTRFQRIGEGERDWPGIAAAIASRTAVWYDEIEFFTDAPEELARPLLAGWRTEEVWAADAWLRILVARYELDALPVTLAIARDGTPEVAAALLPYAAPEIATLMADWLARLKTLRRTATTWLRRHPAEAARALVPPALAKAGTARRQAERALLTLPADTVRAAATTYGPEAEAAITTLLATDPLTVLPPKIPPIPAWKISTPVRLRDGSGILPTTATAHLLTMLAISPLDDPYAGLAIVRQVCEPADLAEFAWEVFQHWQSSGAEAKQNWALTALGLLGDDETARRLTPLIRAWPGTGGHAKAVTGVDVLAAIGSDVALTHLNGIAEGADFAGLRSAAQQKITEVALARGLTPEQLGDRLVTDGPAWLERAMVTGRRWTGAEFRRVLVGHPLLGPLVGQLVWGIYDTAGALIRASSTLEDEKDEAIVGIAHPLQLGDAVTTWTRTFPVQPFPQLSREVYTLTADEAAGDQLTRFENRTVATTRLLALERHGWRRAKPQDAGMQTRMELPITPDLEVAVELEPGIAVSAPRNFPEQKLTEIYLHDGAGGRLPLGRLDPVAASELLRDLTQAAAATSSG